MNSKKDTASPVAWKSTQNRIPHTKPASSQAIFGMWRQDGPGHVSGLQGDRIQFAYKRFDAV